MKQIYKDNQMRGLYRRNFSSEEEPQELGHWDVDSFCDEFSILKQDSKYYLFRIGHSENSEWNGILLSATEEKINELVSEADYGVISNFAFQNSQY